MSGTRSQPRFGFNGRSNGGGKEQAGEGETVARAAFLVKFVCKGAFAAVQQKSTSAGGTRLAKKVGGGRAGPGHQIALRDSQESVR